MEVGLDWGSLGEWLSATKLVSGGTQAELLDGAQGEEGSSRSGRNSPLPDVWVLGIVRNPTNHFQKIAVETSPFHSSRARRLCLGR